MPFTWIDKDAFVPVVQYASVYDGESIVCAEVPVGTTVAQAVADFSAQNPYTLAADADVVDARRRNVTLNAEVHSISQVDICVESSTVTVAAT